MAEYKQQNVSGSVYTRSNRVIIENPYQGVPYMNVVEEDVYLLGENNIQRVSKPLTITKMFDPQATFQLRNPLTDELIPGQFSTQQDLQVLVYSAVRAFQEQRDIDIQTIPEIPVEP